jgi:hypothetical protein
MCAGGSLHVVGSREADAFRRVTIVLVRSAAEAATHTTADTRPSDSVAPRCVVAPSCTVASASAAKPEPLIPTVPLGRSAAEVSVTVAARAEPASTPPPCESEQPAR